MCLHARVYICIGLTIDLKKTVIMAKVLWLQKVVSF